MTRETKNWNVCESKLETWNWKFEVGITKGATMNTWKGWVVQERVEENYLTKVDPADQERDIGILPSVCQYHLSGLGIIIVR